MAKTRYLTTTLLPVVHPGRIKGSQRGNVEHYWAGNKREHGRDGNLFYENGTIYSYGHHFPIARHVIIRKTKKHAILFVDHNYYSSTTTPRHMRAVRSAIPHGIPIIECENVLADSVEDHRENLKRFEEKALKALEWAKAPRKREHTRARLRKDALDLIRQGNAYAEAVGLRDRIGSPESDDLVAWGEKVQAEALAQQKRSQEAAKRKEAKAVKEWEKRLEEWQAGADKAPGRRPVLLGAGNDTNELHRRDLTYVRVSRGKYLQTTLGMTIPLKEVMPVLEAIRKSKAPDGDGNVFEEFTIQDWTGKLYTNHREFVIGCHRITFDEILRAAKAAGL